MRDIARSSNIRDHLTLVRCESLDDIDAMIVYMSIFTLREQFLQRIFYGKHC